VWWNQTPINHIRGISLHSRMVKQDNTLWLPMLHGTGRYDVKKHWFTCEVICFVRRITDEAVKLE
jgi:hypothetical protein